jgi:diadenosine tetraphosphatase ApaH/serine/threonine PP2A family protein phosphatase
VIVCGDIHGQILDLFKLFDEAGTPVKTPGAKKIDEVTYLFLGDYVDRGYQSLETFAFLAFLKVKYPQNVYLLRGNHESRQVNQMYGLFNDCMQLYGHAGIWFLLNDVFDYLPIAAVVDRRIFCVHGGLSPKIALIEQISTLDRKKEIEEGAVADLTWSDPDDVQKFVPNRRGNGYLFGAQQSKQFLLNNKLGVLTEAKDASNCGFIARSHQLAMRGYEWMHDDALVIVWSAPNYTYKSGNLAAVMEVSPQKPVTFKQFDAHQDSSKKPEDVQIEYFA